MRPSPSRWLPVALAAAVVTVAAGCTSGGTGGSASGSSQSGKPITIPFLAELSGDYAYVGGPALAGVQTAVAEINKAGGIGGHDVKIVKYDGQSDPTAEATAVRTILNTQPTLLMTATVSSAFLPSKSIVASANVPIMATTPPLSDLGTLQFFTTYPSNYAAMAGQVETLKALDGGSIKGKKVALGTLAESAIADEKIGIITKLLQDDGATVSNVYKDPTTVSSWSTQAAQLVSSGADALLIDLSPAPATAEARAAAVAGFTKPIITSATASDDSFITGLALPNVYADRAAKPVLKGSPLYQAAQTAGADLTQVTLNNYFAYGYGAMHAAAQALAKCGVSCSAKNFGANLARLGSIKLPVDAFYGKLDWSGGGASGVNFAQPWAWDPATKAPKAVGDLVTFKAQK